MVASPADASPVVPQRATIIVSSTARFHSRQYRIARGLVERGHEVTVIARWEPGLPREERHAAGYRVLRISAGPLDGVPILGAWRRRRKRRQGPATGSPTQPAAPIGGRLRALRGVVAPFGRSLTIRGLAAAASHVAPPADLYHAMTYTRIPVGLTLGRRQGAKVVYDAADIYMDSGQLAGVRGPGRWLLARAERRAARSADRVVTVSDAYATVMEERFGVEYPLVVMNCSYRFTPPATPERRFHRSLALADDHRVVLYQGMFFPHRGVEQLVEAIEAVPRADLVLMGAGPLEAAARTAAARPGSGQRIHVVAPVPPDELLDWVASADVVAVPIQPATLNHRLTTPNKLFEAMAAGVPVVATDLPGMAPIVRDTRCGVLVEPADVGALARGITDVLDASVEVRAEFRERALRAAHERYHWESQLARLLDEYTRLTGRRW